MTKTILITGASSGIGKAAAKHFQAEGWNVVATMRSPEKETELTELNRVEVQRLDVTDLDSIQTAVSATVGQFGSIDAVLNNAGYGLYGPVESVPMENIRRQFETNVLGVIAVTKAVLPHMRKQKSGTILNVSSIGGKIISPMGALYHSTKFAIEGLSEAMQFELEPCGIRVKIIQPGAIKTDFSGRSFDFQNDEAVKEYQPVIQGLMSSMDNFMANASTPDQVAEVICEAANDSTGKLRYPAAGGAEDFLAARASQNDENYFNSMKKLFGIS